MNGKKKFLKAMNVGGCQRCCLRCKKNQGSIAHKYIGGRWPIVEAAPDPSLITWANLGKGKIERCGRTSVSYILALLLLIGGFITVVKLMEVKADVTIDTTICGELEISLQEAFAQYKTF